MSCNGSEGKDGGDDGVVKIRIISEVDTIWPRKELEFVTYYTVTIKYNITYYTKYCSSSPTQSIV